MTTPPRQLLDNLRELIAALDRRVPHLERAGEESIAREAAQLKAAALARIADLEGSADLRTEDSAPERFRDG
jgi:hypothetical protein